MSQEHQTSTVEAMLQGTVQYQGEEGEAAKKIKVIG